MARSAFQDVYVQRCAELAKRFEPDGFRFLKTGPLSKRRVKEWDHRIRFQSSTRNSAGRIVLNVWISTYSRVLQQYRGDVAEGGRFWEGNLGFLRPAGGYREWNLWHSPELVVNTVENLLRSDALPLFRHCGELEATSTELPFSRHELCTIHPADMIDALAAYQKECLIDGYLNGLRRGFANHRMATDVSVSQRIPNGQSPNGFQSSSHGRLLRDAQLLHDAGRPGPPPDAADPRSLQAGRLINALFRAGRLDLLAAAG